MSGYRGVGSDGRNGNVESWQARGARRWPKTSKWLRDLTRPAFRAPVGQGETRTAFNLRIVLPGVRPGDVRLAIENRTLHVTGERRPPRWFAESERCQLALAYGSFSEAVVLPEGLDVQRMQTDWHDGVLDIRFPFVDAEAQAIAVGLRPIAPVLLAEIALPVPA